MEARRYGGILMRNLPFSELGRRVLADGPYYYSLERLRGPAELTIDSLRSFTFYLLEAAPGSELVCRELKRSLSVDDVLQAENTAACFSLERGEVAFLLAGANQAGTNETRLTHQHRASFKEVQKPWGYELWLTGEHPGYCFKKIGIRAGTRTSLQYHRQKRETNLVLSGQAKLIYKDSGSLSEVRVNAGSREGFSIDVPPGELHRIEAVSDLVLMEVSTPHVDDVVRVHDDSLRPDGRVAAEHEMPAPEGTGA